MAFTTHSEAAVDVCLSNTIEDSASTSFSRRGTPR